MDVGNLVAIVGGILVLGTVVVSVPEKERA